MTNIIMSANSTLLERMEYAPEGVTREELMQALARLEHLESIVYDCDLGFEETADSVEDQIDAKVSASVEKQCPDYASYKQFFEDCFECLGGHYPCASVTSDYDQSVIFDAIRLGEESRAEDE